MSWEQKTKQKPVALHIAEQRMLHEIGLAMEKQGIELPSVRRDSPQWKAWRTYLHAIGLPTGWRDKQPPEYMLTVTFEWPPVNAQDLDSHHAKWVKGKGPKGKVLEQ